MPIAEYTSSKGLVQKTGTGGLDITEGTLNPTAVPTAGTGITTGAGTVIKHCHERLGSGIIRTSILIDLTGLQNDGSLNSIIGKDATANCHLGQVKASTWGTVFGGMLTCLEVPANGNGASADIDVYAATEATGAETAAVTDLTETSLGAAGGNLVLGTQVALSSPSADKYLYLAAGNNNADGPYTAGRLLLEFWGTV